METRMRTSRRHPRRAPSDDLVRRDTEIRRRVPTVVGVLADAGRVAAGDFLVRSELDELPPGFVRVVLEGALPRLAVVDRQAAVVQREVDHRVVRVAPAHPSLLGEAAARSRAARRSKTSRGRKRRGDEGVTRYDGSTFRRASRTAVECDTPRRRATSPVEYQADRRLRPVVASKGVAAV